MLLFDRRLRFARALTEHWLEIRGGAMVPLDEDIDPRALVGCFNFIGIADLMQPAQVIIELAGAGMRRRFGRDIRDVDWVDLVPPALGEAGKRARARIRSVPCGYYHQFTALCDHAAAVTVETLVLPLRRRIAAAPDAVIAITRDVDRDTGSPPTGWLTPSTRVEVYVYELVDLGAGVSTEA
jgi:hypothetical protein